MGKLIEVLDVGVARAGVSMTWAMHTPPQMTTCHLKSSILKCWGTKSILKISLKNWRCFIFEFSKKQFQLNHYVPMTMIFFKGGEAQGTLVGNQPKAEILKNLKDLI